MSSRDAHNSLALLEKTPDPDIEHFRSLAKNALLAWNINDAKLTLIKHRENAVFKVVTQNGDQFAMRIHRLGYHSDAALLSELQWIHALAKSGIELPEVIPTADGRFFVTASANDNFPAQQTDLLAWVEGEQLGSVNGGLCTDPAAVQSIYRVIGKMAARLHNQASEWQLPEGFQRHAWDAEGLVGEQPFWGPFWALPSLTEKQRELLQTARSSVRQALERYGQDPQRYSMIHADFVPENLLLEGSTVRLIDFDDAGFGWHMFEIATALYFIQDDPHYSIAKAALIEGYREHRALPESELETLPMFLAARGFTYLGWVQDRQETETAQKMTPELVSMACKTAAKYLAVAPQLKSS